MNRQRALDVLDLRPADRIPHWEALACPAFEQLITGIDPYQHPRRAKQRMHELLPLDVGGIPGSDDPIPRLADDFSSFEDEEGRLTVRWGTGKTWHWDWGHRFKTIEDVLAYEPLQHMDQREGDVVANYDYSLSVEELAANFQRGLDAARQATADLALVALGFYNTLFMWPLLTFGWELFCYVAMLHPEEMRRLLRDFAERSRRIFKALALTDVEMITSHDDICCARGPSFSPAWLREFIYPYYEEFWSYPREAGIKVIFVSDGNLDDVADDIFACGADGIRAEPFTNWRSVALRHPDKILSGEGDARILVTEDRRAIEREVKRMVTTASYAPGYFMCCGNQMAWNLSPIGIKMYFDACDKYCRA